VVGSSCNDSEAGGVTSAIRDCSPLLDTGMRLEEVFRIEAKHLDFIHGQFSIHSVRPLLPGGS
jgi:hypothetical protein